MIDPKEIKKLAAKMFHLGFTARDVGKAIEAVVTKQYRQEVKSWAQ